MTSIKRIQFRIVSLMLFVLMVGITCWSSPFAGKPAEAGVRSAARTGFMNGSFEADADGATTVTNWTMVGAGVNNTNGAYTDKIDLGVTSLGGCVSQDTTDYAAIAATGATPSLAIYRDDNSFNPQGLSAANWLTTVANVSTTMAAGVPIVAGSKVLFMNNAEFGGSRYRVIHGPAVVSDVFSADAGYEISFDWYAQYVRDNFAILGYLLDTSTCTQTEIVDETGKLISGWQNARITIPATSSTYRFIFVNGTFDQSGGTNSGATMYIDNITVGAPQTINFVLPATINKTDSPYTLPATATSTLGVTYTSSTPSVCTVSGGVVTIVATSGTCTIAAHQTGGTSGSMPYVAAVDVSQSFTVTNFLAQTITFATLPDKDLTAADFGLTATASSTLAVSYTSNSTSICTVSGSTVHLVASGVCSITAAQGGGTAGGNTYVAATSVTRTFNVKAAQTITFGALADKASTDPDFTLAATASSGLTVTYTSTTPLICTVSGTTVAIVGPGTCSITADQAGGVRAGTTYSAAPSVTQTFVVSQGQTITFATLPDKDLTAADFGLTATASSTLPVSYTSNSTGICTVSGSTVHIVAAGTCSITAAQAGGTTGGVTYSAAASVTRTFKVKQPQTITFAALPEKLTTDAPFTLAATASSTLAVTYTSTTPLVCTVSGTRVTMVGPGTCSITADQAGGVSGAATYSAAPSVIQTFVVKQGQTITFPVIGKKNYKVADFDPNATASSTLAVSYTSSTPSVCTIVSGKIKVVAIGSCTVTAAQAGGTSGGVTYGAAAPVSRTFDVTGMPQTITAAPVPQKYSYDPEFDLAATAVSGMPVEYESVNPAICTVTGKKVKIVGMGTCNVKAKQAGGTAPDGTIYDAAPDVMIVINISNATATSTPTATKTATPTPNKFALKKAAVGASFVLGLLYNNTLVTWGMNKEYQANIPPCCGSNITDVSVGTNFAVALKGGRVYGWGANTRGQIDIPLQAQKDVVSISSGYAHTLALKSNGTVVCWGNNVEKQCNMPKTLKDVTQLAGGKDYSLALLKNGTVIGWGANGSGQIKIPVGLKDVKAITAGCTHALALKKDGNVVGWGSNTFLEAKIPLNLKDVKEIGAGCNYSMAMMNDGTLFGWGRNEYNQITIPEGINNAEHIGVGYVNSIITLRNSVVLAIGAAEHDALVSRTPTMSATPTP